MNDHLAYLDAGSGSYILAAIASGLAGVWFYLRSAWSKLFKRGEASTAEPAEPNAASAAGVASDADVDAISRSE